MLGNVPEMRSQSQAAIQANPLAPSSYQVLAEVLWQGYHYYEQIEEHERAQELAQELVSIEQMVEEQEECLNPNRTWNQKGLEVSPEVRERIADTRAWLRRMGSSLNRTATNVSVTGMRNEIATSLSSSR